MVIVSSLYTLSPCESFHRNSLLFILQRGKLRVRPGPASLPENPFQLYSGPPQNFVLPAKTMRHSYFLAPIFTTINAILKFRIVYLCRANISDSTGEEGLKEEVEWNGDKLSMTTTQPLHPTIDLFISIDKNGLGSALCVLCGSYSLFI